MKNKFRSAPEINAADLLYDLSETQIEGVKNGFVTDYKVEEIKESMRHLILKDIPSNGKGCFKKDRCGYELALQDVRKIIENYFK